MTQVEEDIIPQVAQVPLKERTVQLPHVEEAVEELQAHALQVVEDQDVPQVVEEEVAQVNNNPYIYIVNSLKTSNLKQ